VRLFFALWPDAGTRARLDDWARAMHAACGGRRTGADKLHQTLAFLGDVSDVAPVEAAMERVPPRRFTLRVDQPGYWKKNRIAWAGCSAVPAELADLVAELRGSLEDAGVAFDEKPFAVHITLARDARPPASMPVLEPIDWPVDGFALVGSAGGRYDLRKTLSGSAG
jgi:RNA 2',3'-cyclic 3'-phosphodiesterase